MSSFENLYNCEIIEGGLIFTFPGKTRGDLFISKDEGLLSEFVSALKSVKFKSFYFESPNICKPETPLGFHIMKSETLHGRKADRQTFKKIWRLVSCQQLFQTWMGLSY